MKKQFITLFLLLVAVSFSYSQKGKMHKEKQEQIKSLKVAYITNELDLTADESAKFWPIYNTFEDKQQELKKQKLKGYLKRMDEESIDNIPEKEAVAMLNQIESAEEELHQLRKKFILNLKAVLPAGKILKLKRAEEGFNRKLLQQYRDKRIGK